MLEDLDQGDLGGRLSWDPPADVQQVTSYVAYFASVCQVKIAVGCLKTVGGGSPACVKQQCCFNHALFHMEMKQSRRKNDGQ